MINWTDSTFIYNGFIFQEISSVSDEDLAKIQSKKRPRPKRLLGLDKCQSFNWLDVRLSSELILLIVFSFYYGYKYIIFVFMLFKSFKKLNIVHQQSYHQGALKKRKESSSLIWKEIIFSLLEPNCSQTLKLSIIYQIWGSKSIDLLLLPPSWLCQSKV